MKVCDTPQEIKEEGGGFCSIIRCTLLFLFLITSVDGVPFLMHDRTLQRTTDVEKVFPDRQMVDASYFNWTDLQQLNAGQWFLKVAPGYSYALNVRMFRSLCGFS